MPVRLAALALSLLLAATCADAGSWPRFRGPNGEGVAQGQNIPVEFNAERGLLWKTPIPGDGNSSPIVWDQHIFLQSASHDGKERILFCLDAKNGKIRWQRSFQGIHVKLPVASSSLASASAAVDGEAVYIPIWDGSAVHLKALDFEGKLLWNRTLSPWSSQHGPGSSPIVLGDKVILCYDMDKLDAKGNPLPEYHPAALMAFNKKTGDLVWEAPRPGYRACYSAPFLHERNGKQELIVVSTLSIAGYDPDSGKELWNWDWGWEKVKVRWPLRTVASPVMAGDTLIATSGDGGGDRRMVALTLPKNGGAPSYAWGDGNKLFPYVSGPLAKGDHVYFVNDRGFAGCYHAKTGKQVWYERLEGATFMSSPVLIDGLVYAPSVEGDVFVFAAQPTFTLLAKNTLGERFRASPAVADGRMYLRGQAHLFCIGQK